MIRNVHNLFHARFLSTKIFKEIEIIPEIFVRKVEINKLLIL